jgi:hypothetical protein
VRTEHHRLGGGHGRETSRLSSSSALPCSSQGTAAGAGAVRCPAFNPSHLPLSGQVQPSRGRARRRKWRVGGEQGGVGESDAIWIRVSGSAVRVREADALGRWVRRWRSSAAATDLELVHAVSVGEEERSRERCVGVGLHGEAQDRAVEAELQHHCRGRRVRRPPASRLRRGERVSAEDAHGVGVGSTPKP